MGDLALPNLIIENFRLFERLEIERLGRLNLITGKNGSGKSCLLEAVELWAARGSFSTAAVQARRRKWPVDPPEDPLAERPGYHEVLEAASAFFHGWPRLIQHEAKASICANGETLRIGVGWGPEGMGLVPAPDDSLGEAPQWWAESTGVMGQVAWQRLDMRRRRSRDTVMLPSEFVPPGGYTAAALASIWDRAVVTEAGTKVEASLSLLHPGTGRVNAVLDTVLGERVLVAILAGAPRAVPVDMLGGGAVRFLEIGYSVVVAEGGGVLLIDEFENGLHVSVQQTVWELLLTLARELNVQVFASTHSWDCVEAFQAATAACTDEEAYIIRLEQSADGVRAVEYDRRRMAIATESAIEVR